MYTCVCEFVCLFVCVYVYVCVCVCVHVYMYYLRYPVQHKALIVCNIDYSLCVRGALSCQFGDRGQTQTYILE